MAAATLETRVDADGVAWEDGERYYVHYRDNMVHEAHGFDFVDGDWHFVDEAGRSLGYVEEMRHVPAELLPALAHWSQMGWMPVEQRLQAWLADAPEGFEVYPYDLWMLEVPSELEALLA